MTRERAEFIHLMMKYALAVPAYEARRAAIKILRYATTHVRIETELTNGYKDRAGNWDEKRTIAAKAKRDRIDAKMEQAAQDAGVRIVYGALTVSVMFTDRRQVYVP